MSEKIRNPYLRLVPACVFLQYTYEAQQQGMSLNQYIGWLKRKAHIWTPYDTINYRLRKEQEQADSRQQRILQEVSE